VFLHIWKLFRKTQAFHSNHRGDPLPPEKHGRRGGTTELQPTLSGMTSAHHPSTAHDFEESSTTSNLTPQSRSS